MFFQCSHQLDLLEFRSLDSKICSHLDNLAGADEIVRVGTESFYPRAKLAATHPLRDVKAKLAFTIRPVVLTEFTNYHNALLSVTNRYSLKARFAFPVFPRNIQHIGFDFTCDYFQALQLVVIGIRRFPINPGSMGEDGFLFRLDRI